MKRLFVNGSPRGKESNSRLILSWIAEGMARAGVSEGIETVDLARTRELYVQRAAFLAADEVVMAMPLYTDSMPALVKRFIDSLADARRAFRKDRRVRRAVGFPRGRSRRGARDVPRAPFRALRVEERGNSRQGRHRGHPGHAPRDAGKNG